MCNTETSKSDQKNRPHDPLYYHADLYLRCPGVDFLCPWGLRVYYYNCSREGGHSGWLANNLNQSEEAPAFHAVTARWTFNEQWDPEAKIRELWHVLGY